MNLPKSRIHLLTIIYPKGKNLARGVCSEDGSIALESATMNFVMN